MTSAPRLGGAKEAAEFGGSAGARPNTETKNRRRQRHAHRVPVALPSWIFAENIHISNLVNARTRENSRKLGFSISVSVGEP
jgi:hypothetical protein